MSIEDTYIRHHVELAKLTKGELEALKRRFVELQKGVTKTLHGYGALATWSKARVESQIALIEGMISSFYSSVEAANVASQTTLAGLEAAWNNTALAGVSGAATAAVSGSSVIQAVLAEPFQGATYSKWWAGLDADLQNKVSANLRQAWATGETLGDVEKRLSGALNRANQNASSVVRSGIMDIAAEARAQTYAENQDVVWAQIWTATLDARTSMACRMRDGRAYTIEGKPIGHKMPYRGGPGRIHWGCRSTSVPVLKGEKPSDVANEFSRPSFDYNKTTTSRAASTLRYDAERRELVKKGVRRPSAERRGKPTQTKSRYGEWLKRQPAWVQDKILGKRKGALYRKGDLKLTTFSEDGLKPLTIKQLQDRGYEL